MAALLRAFLPGCEKAARTILFFTDRSIIIIRRNPARYLTARMGTFNVSLKTLTDRVSMEVVYTPKELDQICVEIAEVNRPGLFLAGYYDYFDKLRLQIMGLAEMNFLSGLSPEKRYEALDQLFRQQRPRSMVLHCCAPMRPPAL